MPDAAFEALKQACHSQISWLLAQAVEYENGRCQHHLTTDGNFADISGEIAEQLRHQANNLQTVINAYERLRPKQL